LKNEKEEISIRRLFKKGQEERSKKILNARQGGLGRTFTEE